MHVSLGNKFFMRAYWTYQLYDFITSLPFHRPVTDHSPDREPHSESASYPQIRSSCPSALLSCSVGVHSENLQSRREEVPSILQWLLILPFPVTENLLCYFVACMGQEGLACSSIRTHLSGICQLQISAGFHDPHIDQMPCLNQVLKGRKQEL